MKPDRIFGFIFFQVNYDNVELPNDEAIKKEYEKERFKFVVKLKTTEIGTDEWPAKKQEFEKAYDLEHREKRFKELENNFKGKPMLGNLPKTEDDARVVYKFLGEYLCT